MVHVDVADETFLAVAPTVVARAVAEQARWRRWWPDLRLTVHHDRGVQGLRWQVAGALTGSAELWLEPVLDGTVLHYFLRAEVAESSRDRPGSPASAVAARRRQGKAMAFGLKHELEAGRAAGEPPPDPTGEPPPDPTGEPPLDPTGGPPPRDQANAPTPDRQGTER